MTTIEKTGTSVEQLIRAFRNEHRIKDWELRYDIIKKPSRGILGLFANKTAVVRFELPAIEERVTAFMDNLLKKMGIAYERLETKKEGKTVYLEIKGCQDTGFLIGKNGNMLETLQFFVNRIYEGEKTLDRVFLDTNGYRDKREATFLRQFLPVIAKVKSGGKSQTLDPMNATDRRIIHRHIERDKSLRTLTVGEGEMKRIVIFSSKQSEKDVNPNAAPEQKKRQFRRPPRPKKQDSTD